MKDVYEVGRILFNGGLQTEIQEQLHSYECVNNILNVSITSCLQ